MYLNIVTFKFYEQPPYSKLSIPKEIYTSASKQALVFKLSVMVYWPGGGGVACPSPEG